MKRFEACSDDIERTDDAYMDEILKGVKQSVRDASATYEHWQKIHVELTGQRYHW